MLRFLDGGESHGKGLCGILDGFPSNVNIDIDKIQNGLKRRQKGYGRGNRMNIENDKIDFISGIRNGKTTGAPISFIIYNKDYENWVGTMNNKECKVNKITIPRPGHADLNGILKYNLEDIRDVIERSSARNTAIKVAIGEISMELLKIFNVKIYSRVVRIGKIYDDSIVDMSTKGTYDYIETSPVRCYDKNKEIEMIKQIDIARESGDTLGGIVEVSACNVPCGLGSYSSYDKRIDCSLSGSLMSIQGVKAVEIGDGILSSSSFGTEANDEIIIANGIYSRSTNHAGGIEGGITNGMPIVVKAYMKPIPTTRKGINSIDLFKNKVKSRYERSDVCALPALGVICESVLAFEIAKAFLDKFNGDSLDDITNSFNYYIKRIARG